MNHIEKYSIIKKEKLDAANYFTSFMQEASEAGAFSEMLMERIQIQLFQLISDLTRRYTVGDSSSIPVDTAEELLDSIYFTIGIYLKKLDDCDLCVQSLRKMPLNDIFMEGKENIKKKIKICKKMFEAVQGNRIYTENISYNETLNLGIGAFLKAYDCEFGAQNMPGDIIDYPLSRPMSNLVGIEFFVDYLNKLYLENEFCCIFEAERIKNVMMKYDPEYQHVLINIFERVLSEALGCQILGSSIFSLRLDDADRGFLFSELILLDDAAFARTMEASAYALFDTLAVTNKTLQKYVLETVKGMLPFILQTSSRQYRLP